MHAAAMRGNFLVVLASRLHCSILLRTIAASLVGCGWGQTTIDAILLSCLAFSINASNTRYLYKIHLFSYLYPTVTLLNDATNQTLLHGRLPHKIDVPAFFKQGRKHRHSVSVEVRWLPS
jgi:hypothetical protein